VRKKDEKNLATKNGRQKKFSENTQTGKGLPLLQRRA
jgi:hypothetical protein